MVGKVGKVSIRGHLTLCSRVRCVDLILQRLGFGLFFWVRVQNIPYTEDSRTVFICFVSSIG